jgi:nucleoid-associated protein YgaU
VETAAAPAAEAAVVETTVEETAVAEAVAPEAATPETTVEEVLPAAIADAPVVEQALPQSLPTYTIQIGDTLWSIAASPQIYNNPYLWPQLFTVNRENLSEPDNPDLILPGQILQIPGVDDRRFYLVQEGDSLTSIAADPRVYNDPFQWTRLYDSNRSRLTNPENPHYIVSGMILDVPLP